MSEEKTSLLRRPVILMIPVVVLLVVVSTIQFAQSWRSTLSSVESGLTMVTGQLNGDLDSVNQYINLYISEDESYLRLSQAPYLDLSQSSMVRALTASLRTLSGIGNLYPNVTAAFIKFPCLNNFCLRGAFDSYDTYRILQELDLSDAVGNRSMYYVPEGETSVLVIRENRGTRLGYRYSLQNYIGELQRGYPIIHQVLVRSEDASGTETQTGILIEQAVPQLGVTLAVQLQYADILRSMPIGVFILVLLSLASIAVVPMVSRMYYRRMYAMELAVRETQINYYAQQIRPHFILNALNHIYIHGSKEWELVRQEIMYLTRYFRYVVNATKNFVGLSEEMRFIRNYLEIQKMIRGDRFFYMISIDKETENKRIPPLIITSILENSIKYALSPEEMCCISVNAEMEEDTLKIRISDSGPGFPEATLEAIQAYIEDPEEKKDAEGLGIGITNTINRLWFLYKGKARIEFSNDSGAVVCLWLPEAEEKV